MPRIIVHHTVKDFAQWKKVFAQHVPLRKAAGFTKSRIFQKMDDPQHVTVQLDCIDIKKAKAFMQSPDLPDAMKKAGVVSVPIVYFLNDGETLEG